MVGTGASAIQIVPEIQPEVARLVLFQRTPAWVMPRRDRAITGAGGLTLAQTWGGDMRALRGTTVPGFPNLCLVVGPNTGLGHSSMIHIIESQLRYILGYLAVLDRTGAAALDARPGALERWSAGIEARMASSVWATGGCVSWYLNAAGRNTTLWPGSTLRFRRATRRLDISEYRVIAA